MTDAAIIVSRQGNDVLGTANTDPNNMIFDSRYNTFKILSQGTQSITVGTAGGTATIAHGVSQIPTAYGFFKYASGKIAPPAHGEYGTVNNQNTFWEIEMDSTNLYFIFYNFGTSSYSGTLVYYTFEAPGS